MEKKVIFENKYGQLYEGGEFQIDFNFKDFDVSHEEYFYYQNHPEEEDANLIFEFYQKIYTLVVDECNKSGGEYTIDCFKDHYTVRKVSDIEQIHYNAMTDEEKAQYDLQKQREAIEKEIQELKTYLSDTNYIVEGTEEEFSATREEYEETLAERKKARKRIDELRKELKSLS